MGITHEWNGTVLTITSDSGTSSADLKGEKGDTGIRGPQGAHGNVDFADLTEEQKNDLVNVDSTYNPESSNAQSGIAVAEALTTVGEKPWTFLNDITLTEAVNEIDEGLYDKQYNEIWIEGTITFDTDYGSTSKTGLFYISFCQSATNHTEYWGSITNGRMEYFRAHGYRTPSGYTVLDTVHGTGYYVGQNGKQTPGANKLLNRQFNQCRFGIGEEGGKTGIRFGVGTTIKVWGR